MKLADVSQRQLCATQLGGSKRVPENLLSTLSQTIEQPDLHVLVFERSQSHSTSGYDPLSSLQSLRESLLSLHSRQSELPLLLKLVKSAWGGSFANGWDDLVMRRLDECWLDVQPLVNEQNILAILFEIEGFASYVSGISKFQLCASGFFEHNWVDVVTVELQDCRATELCMGDRLLAEVLSLPHGRFAPIVLNEYNCVADGNHRLVAVWIWNLLSYCRSELWSWDCEPFTLRVTEFLKANRDNMGAVVFSETVRHLQEWLSNPETCQNLHHALAPELSDEKYLRRIPAILVSEYSSGAVVKASFDKGAELLTRLSPRVYEYLQANELAVLASRAAYHFTDCSLLPWFHLVSSAEGTAV